jgi:hypothetical protein
VNVTGVVTVLEKLAVQMVVNMKIILPRQANAGFCIMRIATCAPDKMKRLRLQDKPAEKQSPTLTLFTILIEWSPLAAELFIYPSDFFIF